MTLTTTDSSHTLISTFQTTSSIYSTRTTPTITPAPVALTTPFIFRDSSCLDIWATTSVRTTYYRDGVYAGTDLLIVYSDASDQRFTSCQPPGWTTVPEIPFTFSPAVCPSGWTQSHISTNIYSTVISSTKSRQLTATTAYCCAR